MNQNLRELLLRSLEEELSEQGRQLLDKALLDSVELREEKRKLIKLRESLAGSGADSFGPFFVGRVMTGIKALDKRPANGTLFFEMMFRWFRPVATVGLTLILLFTVFNLIRANDVSIESALGISDNSTEQIWETPLEQYVSSDR